MTVVIRPASDVRISNDLPWGQIKSGDRVEVTGDVESDNTILAHVVDVNVSQIWGRLVEIQDGAWIVQVDRSHTDPILLTDKDGRLKVQFDPERPPVDVSGNPLEISVLLSAKPGIVVMIVVNRDPNTPSLTVTRVLNVP